MILSAALDSRLAFGVVVMFSGLVYLDWSPFLGLKWWGKEN